MTLKADRKPDSRSRSSSLVSAMSHDKNVDETLPEKNPTKDKGLPSNGSSSDTGDTSGVEDYRGHDEGAPKPYLGMDGGAIHSIARELSRASSVGLAEAFPMNDPRYDPSSDDFNAAAWAQRMAELFKNDPGRYPQREMGVSFRNLNAYGYNQDVNYQVTIGNLPLAGMERLFGWVKRKLQSSTTNSNSDSLINILQPMDGVARPGELVMVLGRPGAGCSTFLRTIAGRNYGFELSKDTEINYMGVNQDAVSKHYRGDVSYCAESELHFPTLTVGQTLMFAAKMKTPENRLPGVTRLEHAKYMRDVYMAMFGLSHTVNTKVGNDLIRGVSGGERKRVSIAELALAGSSLQCWDNSTRGLDSATALEFVRTLRVGAENFRSTSFVAVYQASEEMYELFDKVQVLYEGYQIYYGPITKATEFFYNMGWQPKPRQPTPDFLTSLSQPSEREARAGYENKVPRTGKEFHERWIASDLYKELIAEIEEFNAEYPEGGEHAQEYQLAYHASQDRKLPRKAAYTAGWWEQIKALNIRGWQRMIGDPTMPATTIFGQLGMGLIVSSIFYNLQGATSSFYFRTAAVFFALLFNAFTTQLEIFALYEARDIVQKHHGYAFYHPTIDAISSTITELPVKIISCLAFNLALYFLTNLRREPGNFFFYLFVNFLSILYMSFFFRTLGAMTPTLQVAMVPSGVILLAMVLFTGFVIPVTRLKGTWCRWINYIDPLAYSYEALMTNEFHNRRFECSEFVPMSPDQGATGESFVCSTTGSVAGSRTVLGDDYLGAQYEYYYDHQWRNVGIIFGFVFFLMGTYMLAVYLNPGSRTKGEVLVYPRSVLRRMIKQRHRQDAEGGSTKLSDSLGGDANEKETEEGLIESSDDIFYWKDVCYDVKVKGETRRLLNYVDGWVKPGTLTALMGASGAGKTTLLDTLANRVTMGIVYGDIYVNGTPRDNSFQRTTGYAMQQDLHMETATVRESLVFAAVLRQPASVPYKEKMAYVDNVLKILEMESYADAVVGVAGKGLNVEQRKRLTIGVELAAKPKLLLFLDEPTSGLDSQTAWSVCQLLKKLSAAGQAILCTIHQPSALLIQQFDRLLFLAKGGRTVYFGEIGENSKTLTGYFEKYGADPCPPDANPAEWMLSVIGAAPGSHAKHDYARIWLTSEERRAVRQELDSLMERFGASPTNPSTSADNGEYAAPFMLQYAMVFRRTLQLYWRSPFYIFSKLFLAWATSLLNGFSFWYSDTSLQGMQNLMFSVFMFTISLTSTVQQYTPYFTTQRNLYEARERPSKIFSWQAFILSILSAEIPWQTISSVGAFFSWYYPAGLYKNASLAHQTVERGGMTFFYVWLFYLFSVTFGQFVVAGMNDADAASNIAVMMFTMCLLFSGVLATKEAMPGFWIFMYRVNPMTYWIGGMLTLAIANVPVICASNEYVHFFPPDGQTCQQYASAFASKAGGYLSSTSSSGECSYCTLSQTNQYLASVDLGYHLRWRNLGIFWAYLVFNVAATIVLYWIFRVPKSKSRVAKAGAESDIGTDPAIEKLQEEDNGELDTASAARISRTQSRVSRLSRAVSRH